MLGIIVLSILFSPFIELYLIILLIQYFGFLWTFNYLLLSALFGFAIKQSLKNKEFQKLLLLNFPPQSPNDFLHLSLTNLGSYLLIIPGVISELLAFFFILPGPRHILLKFILQKFSFQQYGRMYSFHSGFSNQQKTSEDIIDVSHQKIEDPFQTIETRPKIDD